VSVIHVKIFGYRLDNQGIIFLFPSGIREFSLPSEVSREVLGAHPASYSMDRPTGPLCPGARLGGREADPSFPASYEAKSKSNYNLLSPPHASWLVELTLQAYFTSGCKI
jgi:hypothetical protein